MIISASYRTDIPAFYGAWFLNRLAAGYVRTVNPYGGQVSFVSLSGGAVDGFVFWTRNLEPFFDALDVVRAKNMPFVVHYTVTGYPRALDAATIRPERAIAHIREVASAFGPGTAVWRYDPIVLTSLTPPAWHRRNFDRLCRAMAGAVDEVVVSFAQIYRKTARNMSAAATAMDFDWWDPPAEDKRALLLCLADIADSRGLRPTLCDQPELRIDGVCEARCIDAERLGRVAGRPIDAPRRPHRKTCGCWASRDIGAYDSCPHGCAYCYAVNSRQAAKRRFGDHDPDSEFLVAAK
jgi:hypothetical protein